MNVNELMYDLEECKLEVESVLWEIVCDKRGVESVVDGVRGSVYVVV